MGQLNVAELNPIVAVADGVKAIFHDCRMFVCNACSLRSNCCGGCWPFTIITTETHESDSSSDSSDSHCCGQYTPTMICNSTILLVS